MKKIAITTTTFGKDNDLPLQLLKESGFEVALNPYGRKLEWNEVIEIVSGVEGFIAGIERLDKSILKRLPDLKVISRCGAGLDNVDLEAADKLGIKVYSTPFGPTMAVAELTVGLIFDVIRKISLMDKSMRMGKWEKQMGNLLYGKKVGIIGFGRIGKKVAELLSPFGVEIAYSDILFQDNFNSCISMDRKEILGWADILTLHCTASADGKPILGVEELRKMKKGSWLINVSRGGLVDEAALYDSVKEGHLSGVALDVFVEEPYKGPLIELENVILTPHIGSYAKESRTEMEMQAVRNLIEGLND